jgi:putative tricarboxylic transport membrane protein
MLCTYGTAFAYNIDGEYRIGLGATRAQVQSAANHKKIGGVLMKRTLLLLVIMLSLTTMLFANGQGESDAPYPDNSIEFVVPASAGGGSDTLARLLVEIMQKNDLVDETVVVVNKPGGASAVGHAYIASQRNPNYTIFTMNGAHALAAKMNPDLASDFTPIANLALDHILLVTKSGSEFTNLEDALAAAKADPKGITIGIADNLDLLSATQINDEAGVQFSTVYFDGAGEIVTAMLGDHVDFGILNPNECIGQVRAGALEVVASFSEERLDAPFDTVPTFAELGYPNVQLSMFRSIMGAPGMSREAQMYWSDVFEKVTATDQWKQSYIETKVLEGRFMGADEYGEFHERTATRLFNSAEAIGLTD